MNRARLQEKLQKQKKEASVMEKLDAIRAKLETSEFSPALLLTYMEAIDKYHNRSLSKPLVESSPLHSPFLGSLDDFTNFQAKFNEIVKKKKSSKKKKKKKENKDENKENKDNKQATATTTTTTTTDSTPDKNNENKDETASTPSTSTGTDEKKKKKKKKEKNSSKRQ